MAGVIGIGNGTIHEPTLLDGAGLGPASWDIRTELGFGTVAIIGLEVPANYAGDPMVIQAL
tara:strand:+ start:606 stop:788 length:183 start_codon:yes stop_codon:yes gene_type:complete